MKKIIQKVGLAILSILFFFPLCSFAQDGVALTLTPPLFKNNISPGQIWKSAIKVVNNNTTPIDIYLQVMDFKGGSESGTVNFITDLPEGEAGNEYLLSRWINIDPGPISLKPNESKEIPFIVDVPQKVTPGGHYAAIMAGTKPPAGTVSGSAIKVSSLISSLLLLSTKGDVTEDGKIRDFSTENFLYNKPDVKFQVRFENDGNVHLQPQGEIRIFDMYGKDQGRMTLNHNSEFGNVLPGETRKWDFDWQGDDSLWSMGRYRASLVIGFGDQAYQTDTRELYFWVLDFVLLGTVLGGALVIIILMILSIRFYIRRAIRQTRADVESLGLPQTQHNRLRINVDGAENQVVDLKQSSRPAKSETAPAARKARKEYSLWRSLLKIFAWLLIIALVVFGAVFYLNQKQDSGNIGETSDVIDNDEIDQLDQASEEVGEVVEVDTEAVKPTATSTEPAVEKTETDETGEKENSQAVIEDKLAMEKAEAKIVILNGSGQPGVAGRAQTAVESKGFAVDRLGNADSFRYDITKINYKKGMETFAKEIMGILKVEAELVENDLLEEEIMVVLGADY